MTCTRNKIRTKVCRTIAAAQLIFRVTVSRTNALAGLPVREPFERYGGDAYFDENWQPLMIVDEGLSKLEEDSKKDCSSKSLEYINLFLVVF